MLLLSHEYTRINIYIYIWYTMHNHICMFLLPLRQTKIVYTEIYTLLLDFFEKQNLKHKNNNLI